MRRKNSEITNRKIVQDRIREVYPERLGQYELSCCACCLYRKDGACRWELLPVTSQGEMCPYFTKKTHQELTEVGHHASLL